LRIRSDAASQRAGYHVVGKLFLALLWQSDQISFREAEQSDYRCSRFLCFEKQVESDATAVSIGLGSRSTPAHGYCTYVALCDIVKMVGQPQRIGLVIISIRPEML
jgi:hypothetical protein